MNQNKFVRILVGFTLIIVILGMDLQQPYFPSAQIDAFGADNSLPRDLEDVLLQLEKSGELYEPLGAPVQPSRPPAHLTELVAELNAVNEAAGDTTDSDGDGLYDSVEAVLDLRRRDGEEADTHVPQEEPIRYRPVSQNRRRRVRRPGVRRDRRRQPFARQLVRGRQGGVLHRENHPVPGIPHVERQKPVRHAALGHRQRRARG